MKTLVKKITGYEFNELDEFAKENAKNVILESNREDGGIFAEDLKYSLIEEFGLNELDTYFSLSYCQGDGLCLWGVITPSELFDNPKFKKIALKGVHHKQAQSVKDNVYGIDFEHKGRYNHANSVDIYIRFEGYPTDKQDDILDKIEKNVREWYFKFCKEWENYGYKYFYEMDDEEMADICEMNEYLFTKDGKLIDTFLYEECA